MTTPERDLAAEYAELIKPPPPPTMTTREIALAHAHGVVAMEREIGDLRGSLASVEHQLAENRRYSKEASDASQKVRMTLFAVKQLHGEAEAVSCGDGCCHEGLGYCDFCGEGTPHPCRTYRVADGEPLHPATEEDGDGD